MIRINTFEFNVVFCSLLLIACWDIYWLLKKALESNCVCTLKASSYLTVSQISVYWNKETGIHLVNSFLVGFETGISFNSFFFFLICRTSLRLGENRGPSVWDVLCWVSLLPQFMLSQMFPFHCTTLGSEWSTLCFCNPTFRFCHQGKEKVGTVGIYFTDSVFPRSWLWSKYRKPRGSCSDD